jgi:hypothetical protein
MYLISYLLFIFGGFLTITGIALFITQRTRGSSSIKMPGFEFIKFPHLWHGRKNHTAASGVHRVCVGTGLIRAIRIR